MKILYFFEPWIWKGVPDIGFGNCIDQFANKQIRALLQTDNILEIACLFGDGASKASVKNKRGLPDIVKTYTISQNELKDIFPNYLDATLKWHNNNYSNSELKKFIHLITEKLENFKPDIIITFLTPAPYWKAIFPDTLHFYTEYGVFSRPPYPESYYFDPFGYFGNSFITKYIDLIKQHKLTCRQKIYLKKLRKTFLAKKLTKNEEVAIPAKFNDFKKKVLLPLQFDNHFVFNGYSKYIDQFDYLCNIMDRIDSSIGVIVTEHNYWGRIINEKNIDYLTTTYPNLIFDFSFQKIKASSQFFLPHIDGIITITSSVGLQGLIWKKPIFSASNKNTHINSISTGINIEEIGSYLDSHSECDQDNILYYLLSHYYPVTKYCFDGDWIYSFFKKSCGKFKKNGVDFDFYEPIDDDKNLFKSIISSARKIR